MAETSTIFGFMKYVSATDILSDFKKTVDSHFVNSLKEVIIHFSLFIVKQAIILFFHSLDDMIYKFIIRRWNI